MEKAWRALDLPPPIYFPNILHRITEGPFPPASGVEGQGKERVVQGVVQGVACDPKGE